MIHRRGNVYYKNILAGYIEETDEGYRFYYDRSYLQSQSSHAISCTIPLGTEMYESPSLHPFFDGLIPEGWILSIVVKNWKINPRDRMGLLLTVCKDCIGAVSVEECNE
ncbi:MAG: HipA N-terminal domain-containing protein [Chitinispirillia bacterium]|jgi:serine/threonine-protein kinase HipA